MPNVHFISNYKWENMYFYNACFFSGPNEDEMKEMGFELR